MGDIRNRWSENPTKFLVSPVVFFNGKSMWCPFGCYMAYLCIRHRVYVGELHTHTVLGFLLIRYYSSNGILAFVREAARKKKKLPRCVVSTFNIVTQWPQIINNSITVVVIPCGYEWIARGILKAGKVIEIKFPNMVGTYLKRYAQRGAGKNFASIHASFSYRDFGIGSERLSYV